MNIVFWNFNYFDLLVDVLIKSRLHITSYPKIDDRSLCDDQCFIIKL